MDLFSYFGLDGSSDGLNYGDYKDLYTGSFDPYAAVTGVPMSSAFPINSPSAVEDADSLIPDDLKAQYDIYGNWLSQMFETQERAAVEQARRNEESAVAAWRRSEQAADNALKRARELRQTEKQDLVASLKAAGLNPVLAAGSFGGTSNTAPQATAPASSSSAAGGMNAADLLTAIAALLSGSGNLMRGISSFLPSNVISQITGQYQNWSESTNYNYNYSYRGSK